MKAKRKPRSNRVASDAGLASIAFMELDKLPTLVVLELSAKTIGPYALDLRRRYKDALNELKQNKTNSRALYDALISARMACKRLKEANVK